MQTLCVKYMASLCLGSIQTHPNISNHALFQSTGYTAVLKPKYSQSLWPHSHHLQNFFPKPENFMCIEPHNHCLIRRLIQASARRYSGP